MTVSESPAQFEEYIQMLVSVGGRNKRLKCQ